MPEGILLSTLSSLSKSVLSSWEWTRTVNKFKKGNHDFKTSICLILKKRESALEASVGRVRF